MDESKDVNIAYLRISGETSGNVSIYRAMSIPGLIINDYPKYLHDQFKHLNSSLEDFKTILGTFKIKDNFNIYNIVNFKENDYDSMKIYMDGKPYINKAPELSLKNRDFKTSIKNKEQLLSYILLENKSKNLRLFYTSMTRDFILVDSEIKEIKDIYYNFDEFKKKNQIGFKIQDVVKRTYMVTWNDLYRFCEKEIAELQNRLSKEYLTYRILIADLDKEFDILYKYVIY